MILVVGDAILDVDRRFTTTRMCPEQADAPVLTPLHTQAEMRLGGALNVWHAIRQLGAECQIITCLGNDQPADVIRQMMTPVTRRVLLGAKDDNPTTVKERVYVDGVLKFRMDNDRRPESTSTLLQLERFVMQEMALHHVDLLVLSDYGKGVLTRPEDMITDAVRRGIPVIVDPKGSDWHRYDGATLIKPNLLEEEQSAYSPDVNFKVVTGGADGMSITGGGIFAHVPGLPRKVVDVTGAGDMACAALAVCLAKRKGMPLGADVVRAVKVANVLAGASVEYQGVKTFTLTEARNECRKHGIVFPE